MVIKTRLIVPSKAEIERLLVSALVPLVGTTTEL